MTLFHVTEYSTNRKTGRMLVTTTSDDSCPADCVLGPDRLAACYALYGPLGVHWRAVSRPVREPHGRGLSLDAFLERLSICNPLLRARHNQAGDLPHQDGVLDGTTVERIARGFSPFASAWTYTHHNPYRSKNLDILRRATNLGLTCNLSADSLAQADRYAQTGLPVVVTVPANHPRNTTTPDGREVIVCPEQTGHTLDCASCPSGGLCSQSDRPYIIAFRAHGIKKTQVKPEALTE